MAHLSLSVGAQDLKVHGLVEPALYLLLVALSQQGRYEHSGVEGGRGVLIGENSAGTMSKHKLFSRS